MSETETVQPVSTHPDSASSAVQIASTSSSVPLYEVQSGKWWYWGREVRSFSASEMYDPLPKFIMAAPLVNPEGPDFVVDAADFRVYGAYTFEQPELEYHPEDTPLLPQTYANPTYWPTEMTKVSVGEIVDQWFPKLVKTSGNDPFPVLTFSSDDAGNTNTSTQSVGLLAHSIEKNGGVSAMATLEAALKQDGVIE